MEWILAFTCKVKLLSNWQDKMGQYSLLESFQYEKAEQIH
jgi:hypothetical protein